MVSAILGIRGRSRTVGNNLDDASVRLKAVDLLGNRGLGPEVLEPVDLLVMLELAKEQGCLPAVVRVGEPKVARLAVLAHVVDGGEVTAHERVQDDLGRVFRNVDGHEGGWLLLLWVRIDDQLA